MKHLIILAVLSISFLSLSCDETNDLIDAIEGNDPDPLINQEIAEAQSYDMTTPFYGMRVAIRNDVKTGENAILDLLDNRAIEFLDCQFPEGSELGFQDIMFENGDMATPLSDLRVFVVPNNFLCEGPGPGACSGIYFVTEDIIVISVGGFGGCGDFAAWRHELGHRYGMDAEHTNIGEYRACTDVDGCEFDDLIGFGIIGG